MNIERICLRCSKIILITILIISWLNVAKLTAVYISKLNNIASINMRSVSDLKSEASEGSAFALSQHQILYTLGYHYLTFVATTNKFIHTFSFALEFVQILHLLYSATVFLALIRK